jgi:hypothetical protein
VNDALILLIKSGHILEEALWILFCRKSHAYTSQAAEYHNRYWSASTEIYSSCAQVCMQRAFQ